MGKAHVFGKNQLLYKSASKPILNERWHKKLMPDIGANGHAAKAPSDANLTGARGQ
jgi:hypothetical protein